MTDRTDAPPMTVTNRETSRQLDSLRSLMTPQGSAVAPTGGPTVIIHSTPPEQQAALLFNQLRSTRSPSPPVHPLAPMPAPVHPTTAAPSHAPAAPAPVNAPSPDLPATAHTSQPAYAQPAPNPPAVAPHTISAPTDPIMGPTATPTPAPRFDPNEIADILFARLQDADHDGVRAAVNDAVTALSVSIDNKLDQQAETTRQLFATTLAGIIPAIEAATPNNDDAQRLAAIIESAIPTLCQRLEAALGAHHATDLRPAIIDAINTNVGNLAETAFGPAIDRALEKTIPDLAERLTALLQTTATTTADASTEAAIKQFTAAIGPVAERLDSAAAIVAATATEDNGQAQINRVVSDTMRTLLENLASLTQQVDAISKDVSSRISSLNTSVAATLKAANASANESRETRLSLTSAYDNLSTTIDALPGHVLTAAAAASPAPQAAALTAHAPHPAPVPASLDTASGTHAAHPGEDLTPPFPTAPTTSAPTAYVHVAAAEPRPATPSTPRTINDVPSAFEDDDEPDNEPPPPPAYASADAASDPADNQHHRTEAQPARPAPEPPAPARRRSSLFGSSPKTEHGAVPGRASGKPDRKKQVMAFAGVLLAATGALGFQFYLMSTEDTDTTATTNVTPTARHAPMAPSGTPGMAVLPQTAAVTPPTPGTRPVNGPTLPPMAPPTPPQQTAALAPSPGGASAPASPAVTPSLPGLAQPATGPASAMATPPTGAATPTAASAATAVPPPQRCRLMLAKVTADMILDDRMLTLAAEENHTTVARIRELNPTLEERGPDRTLRVERCTVQQ